MFQAHDLHYLEPLHNGNIPVYTYHGSSFDVGIDGDYIYVGLDGSAERSQLNIPKNTDFYLRFKKNELSTPSYTKLHGNTSIKEAEKLIKKYQKELNEDIRAVESVWKTVNNK